MDHIKISHDLLMQLENKELLLVLVESPLASSTIEGWVRNKKFAKECLRDCLAKGEAPYASHLLYAQEGLLDDNISEERAIGIHAGLVWGKCASKSIVYTDLGISLGMERGIERAKKEGRLIEYRTLGFIPEVLNEEIELEIKRREIIELLKNNHSTVINKMKMK